ERERHAKPRPSMMIEKFALSGGVVLSEFLDLKHTSKTIIPVSLLIPKFARAHRRRDQGELRHQDIRRLAERSLCSEFLAKERGRASANAEPMPQQVS